MVYAASKAEGERAAFNWVKKNNPGFVFNSVLPDYTVYLAYLTSLISLSNIFRSDRRSSPPEHRLHRNPNRATPGRKRRRHKPHRLPYAPS
ncbi:uncharacterized protein BDV14DRAFT_176512 [Aspergillus stella-maris]|uniref:uncharacterized protein n=1 Tax=Aspergillus stella-maris TaxID=1810926 RepID=UPI003CCE00E6